MDLLKNLKSFIESLPRSNVQVPGIREWVTAKEGNIYIRRTCRRSIQTIEIANVEIFPQFQGKGIFTELLNYIEKYAKDEKYPLVVYVESVHNDRLKEFLYKRGYNTNIPWNPTDQVSFILYS